MSRRRNERQVGDFCSTLLDVATGQAAARFAENVLPIIHSIQATGETRLVKIAEALNARGVRTARSGAWYATTVANVLNRKTA